MKIGRRLTKPGCSKLSLNAPSKRCGTDLDPLHAQALGRRQDGPNGQAVLERVGSVSTDPRAVTAGRHRGGHNPSGRVSARANVLGPIYVSNPAPGCLGKGSNSPAKPVWSLQRRPVRRSDYGFRINRVDLWDIVSSLGGTHEGHYESEMASVLMTASHEAKPFTPLSPRGRFAVHEPGPFPGVFGHSFCRKCPRFAYLPKI